MADIKISALPDASALNGSEVFPITQNGAPAKAYVSGVLINAEETTKKYTNDINVDVLYPLGSGYYTLATAIAAIPSGNLRKIGATITFQSASGIVDRWQYVGTSTSTWATTSFWINTKENSSIRYAKNNTGANVAKGKLVYISGSTGENPLFLLATNTDYNIASRTWGMTYDSINNNAVGRIIHFGLIDNIDTSIYTAGTELWLDINGGYTSTRPTSPTTSIYIGMVICSSATVGSIFVDLRHIPKFTSLSDVKSESYTNGDFPAFNGSTNRFEKTARESVFRDMWTEFGGIYNATTGFYEFRDVVDLTYTQAISVYRYSLNLNPLVSMCLYNKPIKVAVFDISAGGWEPVVGNNLCMSSVSLKYIYQRGPGIPFTFTNLYYTFNNCFSLIKIEPVLDVANVSNFTYAFNLCNSLQNVFLKNIKASISFASSSLLSYDSVNYMMTNASNTVAITITVHAAIYAKLTGTASDAVYTADGHTKAQWMAIVTDATAKNISFATT